MKSFYGEDEICPDCGFEGDFEKAFEPEDKTSQDILHVCPKCGACILRGVRHDDEEYYY